MDEETLRIVARLDASSTPYVLLKGAARRALGADLPYGDARSTRDVDVLVPAERAQVCWDELQAGGYAPVNPASLERTGHYHLPALLGPGRVAVELHTATSRRVAAAESWRRHDAGARTVLWRGVPVRVPGATELLDGALAHAVTDGARRYRLRYWLDAAVVLAAGGGPDRAVIAQRLAAGEYGDDEPIGSWLAAAAWLAGEPGDAVAGVAPFPLTRLLAWRTTVAARWGGVPRLAEALDEAGTRAEAGLPPRPSPPDTPALLRVRRAVANVAAATVHTWWRRRADRP